MAGTRLGIDGTKLTLNGRPTFLLGISYYGALGSSKEFIRHDLDDMQRYGVNWIRVWATWAAFGNNVSALGVDGTPREPFLSKLKWLVAECDARGMVVDVTLSRGNGVTGRARLQDTHEYLAGVETIVAALRPHRNWYLDLANEHNIKDKRFIGFTELKRARELVRKLDPGRLVTASRAGDIPTNELDEYLATVGVDLIAPHRPRHEKSPRQTAAKTRAYIRRMKHLGRVVPVHYQEPFRRGFRPTRFEPTSEAFLVDLQQARQGGAAGWCLHNGDQKDRPEGKPRRSFDMREKRLFEQLDEQERRFLDSLTRTEENP